MPLRETSLGLAKLNGPQHPWVSVLNFSQLKRTSAQSAEGMESPIVRKPKARARLSVLKSRRPLYKKDPPRRSAEGMKSPIMRKPKARAHLSEKKVPKVPLSKALQNKVLEALCIF